MYDDLVKRLQNFAAGTMRDEDAQLAFDAIDAISYLQKRVEKKDEQVTRLFEIIDSKDNEIDCTIASLDEYRAMCEALQYQFPRWVPVTERLPGREWVLCKCRVKIYEVLSLRDGYWYHDPQHQYMSGFVTHWMPLPSVEGLNET